jgi:phytoene/squalene synthetase
MSIRQAPVVDADLQLYTRAARVSSARVIHEYSTSFGMASRLFGAGCRSDIESIYGLVRIADEIVDGAATQAGLSVDEQAALLDSLEDETERALACGYSANVVVHAFAATARASGIGSDLTAPFFASMRRDLSPVAFGREELRSYIYGSAEVVGLMCLKVFLRDGAPRRRPLTDADRSLLEEGARRLGAAFQKINFLRDLGTDWTVLGRSYFPGIDPGALTEAEKRELLDDIDADLDAAATAIPRLPDGCRRAVVAAHSVFRALAAELRRTPAEQLLRRRVRVSSPHKAGIILSALLGRGASRR